MIYLPACNGNEFFIMSLYLRIAPSEHLAEKVHNFIWCNPSFAPQISPGEHPSVRSYWVSCCVDTLTNRCGRYGIFSAQRLTSRKSFAIHHFVICNTEYPFKYICGVLLSSLSWTALLVSTMWTSCGFAILIRIVRWLDTLLFSSTKTKPLEAVVHSSRTMRTACRKVFNQNQ